uniref:Uncharacterized protein n=1 Tax=Cajanus cajan TaxID=3821 RepID=A0A151TLB3_CAJCA|nr:hypothetical protein KK1_024178 [Cajanus cajan]
MKLGSFPSDSSGELNVLRHNGDSLSVNSAEVSVFEESNEVSLSGFLKRRNGAALEPQIRFEILCDFANETLKRKLSDEKLGALLVLPDLPESHRSRPEPVGLLHSAGGRSRFPGGLRGQLLPGSLAAGGLAGCLLGTRHLKD